ncbi:MAG: PVC-type heme-binding CxxCH protein [Candidatus Hydrogenedentota bacterium]
MVKYRFLIYALLLHGTMYSGTSSAIGDIEFTLAEGFELETILREPDVQQPLCMNFDERGRLWITQYLQFPFPKGLNVIGHDKYWRIQYDNFPPAAPPNHEKGLDKVTIFEDTNGDGAFDSHKDFVTGLNIATSALPGRGGVWVMNPPYLLFYPDANQDDIPDGDPEVHLAGFGLEDLHAVANGLRWGPDGWLYGYQGSTTTATITRPGMGDEGLHFKGQNLWRYNTEDKHFELFAEGGHNHFGIALDKSGNMFTGSNGGLIGFHQVQGGNYYKSWAKHGELTNEYAYGFFPGMEDHSTRAKLSQGLVSYEAPNFPEEYQQRIFTLRALKRCVSGATLKPNGSTYSAHEDIQLIETDDPHFRPVAMTQGPDGALYIADWHDTNITWSVSAEGDRVMRETGRIYRVSYGSNTPFESFDMAEAATAEVIEYLRHENKWYRQAALRVLYDRKDTSAIATLEKLLWENEGQIALESLWALNASGGFTLGLANKALGHTNPLVRRWTIQLLGNDKMIDAKTQAKLIALAASETDAQVRSQLASTAKRLPSDEGLAIVLAMLKSVKDTDDPHIPLLLWWAVEQHIRQDRPAFMLWANEATGIESALFNTIMVTRLGQRFTQDRRDEDFLTTATLLNLFSTPHQRQAFLTGIAKGLGRGTNATVPPSLNKVLMSLLESDPSNTQLLLIAARLGNTSVYQRATTMIGDATLGKTQRMSLIKLLGEETYAPAKDNLLHLFLGQETDDIRIAALSALQNFNDPAIGKALLKMLPQGGSLKSRIAGALASRKAWAINMLNAVDAGDVPVTDVDRDLLINLAAMNDPTIDSLVQKHWGTIRTSPDEKMAQVNAAWATVKNGPGNAYAGIKVYEESCGKCHVHLGIGREVGPEMTGFNRSDLWDFIINVTDPSRSVLPEYTGIIFTILDNENVFGDLEERTITGFILHESEKQITLVDSSGNEITIATEKVKSMRPMSLSVMPEGLLLDMPDQELRDLMMFIQSDALPSNN